MGSGGSSRLVAEITEWSMLPKPTKADY